MKSPSFTATLIDGQWSCLYVGESAGAAKDAFTTATAKGNAERVMLFVRPQFTKRSKGDVPAPKADAPASKAAKKKGEA